ncbi:type II secretion system protein GspL [Pseudomonas sp. EpS/L25]|uniref:type II secretion system protein GspL n=1 Tax=Pseudomonas sp. EpS/L25 TaxID=1749078 RepID=UPI0007444374|nr:type II secretion system protein GspL [Pseudomonas sp. EpS/L25]KUM41466.1 general secretion pathway protein GspL [Pseudomonas sp. EpS/L25]
MHASLTLGRHLPLWRRALSPPRSGERLLLRTRRPGPPGPDNPLVAARLQDDQLQAATALPASAQPVTLLLHGEDCSLFDVAAPKGLRPHEWGLLLEDHLLADASGQHLVCLGRAPGRLRLLALDRTLLDAWREHCAACGWTVAACWVDFQLLPEPTTEGGIGLRLGDSLRFKTRVDDRELWLTWPRALEASLPPDLTALLTPASNETRDDLWPRPAKGVTPQDLWPRQGRRRTLPTLGLPRSLVLGMAAAAVLAAVHLGLQQLQPWRQAQADRHYVAQRLGLASERLEAGRAARELQLAGRTQRQLEERWRLWQRLGGPLGAALAAQPGLRLVEWSLDEQGIRVALDGPASLDQALRNRLVPEFDALQGQRQANRLTLRLATAMEKGP